MKRVMLVFLCFLLVIAYMPAGIPMEASAAELPEGWLTTAYNGAGGSISYDPKTVAYTIASTGNGIRNQPGSGEQFQYVYTPVSGDFTLIARLVDLPYDDQVQAGILVRGSLDQGSPFVYSYLYGTENLYQPTVTVKSVTQEASVGNSGYSTKYTWEDTPKYLRVRKQWNTNQNRTDVYFDLGVLEGTKIQWTTINGKNITDAGITSDSELLVGLAVGRNAAAKFSNVTLFHSYISSSETDVSDLTQPPEDQGSGDDPGEEEPIDVPPPVLTGLTAFPVNEEVQLSWQTVTGDVYYHVYRSLMTGGPYSEIARLPGSVTQMTDTGLTNNTTYYYYVSVMQNDQEYTKFAEVSATPRVFIINDNYENEPLGMKPDRYSSLLEQSEINNLAVVNTRDVDSRKSSWYTDGDTKNIAPEIIGNSTNVLWVNDKADAGRRGSFVVDFAPVTGGITAQLDFMMPKVVGDSYSTAAPTERRSICI